MRQNQGGKRGDLAIIHRRLISLACVGNNPFHLWLNTSFEEKNIITPEALKHAPQGVRDILLLVKDNTSAIYVHEPLPLGKDRIQKLQHNLRQHRLSPKSSTFNCFEDTIVHWYCDLVLEEGINSTDSTGEENHIFAAFGLIPLKDTAYPPPLSTLYHLSLLPLDTFLIAWLYEIGKHQTQRQKKEFSKPYESGGKLVMHNK